MPILGIDNEKCTRCKLCINECAVTNLNFDSEHNQVVFYNYCILCGHCIAVCPADAIIYKNLKDTTLNIENSQEISSLIPYKAMHELFRRKRSIRQYKKKTIPKDVFQKILDSMKYAPAGGNLRTVKCLIISGEEKIKSLSNSILQQSLTTWPEAYVNMMKTKSKRGLDPIFFNAPHIMIFFSNNQADNVNATIIMTYVMISAETLGLGTCWDGIALNGLIQNKELRNSIPGLKGKVLGVMTLGYPSVKYMRAPPRPAIRIKGLKEL